MMLLVDWATVDEVGLILSVATRGNDALVVVNHSFRRKCQYLLQSVKFRVTPLFNL